MDEKELIIKFQKLFNHLANNEYYIFVRESRRLELIEEQGIIAIKENYLFFIFPDSRMNLIISDNIEDNSYNGLLNRFLSNHLFFNNVTNDIVNTFLTE